MYYSTDSDLAEASLLVRSKFLPSPEICFQTSFDLLCAVITAIFEQSPLNTLGSHTPNAMMHYFQTDFNIKSICE